MDNVAKSDITAKIKELEKEHEAYAQSANEELGKRTAEIQKSQTELQNLLRRFQQEVDKRAGAIEQLKALIEKPNKAGNGKAKLEVVE